MPKDHRIHSANFLTCYTDQQSDKWLEGTVGERLPLPGYEDRPSLLQSAPDPTAPVVLLFHGSNGCVLNLQSRTDLDAIATRAGVTLVWLSGKPLPSRHWNPTTYCCDPNDAQRVDEMAYLDAVLAALRARGLHPRRIITAGVSLGAAMAMAAACLRSDYIDGAVSIAGSLPQACRPHHQRPMSLVAFGGTADHALGAEMPKTIASYWRRHFTRCPSPAEYARKGRRLVIDWLQCKRDTLVRVVSLKGVPHVWPHFDFYDIDDDILALALGTLGDSEPKP